MGETLIHLSVYQVFMVHQGLDHLMKSFPLVMIDPTPWLSGQSNEEIPGMLNYPCPSGIQSRCSLRIPLLGRF